MNIYKNLMFLHGHFVDPRDADEQPEEATATGVPEPKTSRAARTPSAEANWKWRDWLLLWPRETAKVEIECDGCGTA